MKLSTCIFCLAALSMFAPAYADGSGEFTRKGKTVKLTHAYAFRRDVFGETTRIIFSSATIDVAKALADPAGMVLHNVGDQLKQGQVASGSGYVEIDVEDNGEVETVTGFYGSDGISGNVTEKPVFTRYDRKHIAGTFRTEDESEKTGDSIGYYDLKFDLDVLAPAGGGGFKY